MFPFDAVLVLGKELRRDPDRGRRELRARAAAAAAAWRAGARRIYTLEARLRGQEQTGSAIVASYLAELGVPAEAIVVDDRTRSTREEVVEAARRFAADGVRRPLAITALYHVHRVLALFEQQGLNVAVNDPEAMWRFADAREREWIGAGTPDERVMAAEGRVERLLGLLGAPLAPLPLALRSRIEIQAGAWLRG